MSNRPSKVSAIDRAVRKNPRAGKAFAPRIRTDVARASGVPGKCKHGRVKAMCTRCPKPAAS